MNVYLIVLAIVAIGYLVVATQALMALKDETEMNLWLKVLASLLWLPIVVVCGIGQAQEEA